MSDFICINDRNQLPKYIPGYDTPEKAEAASLAMSADQVVFAAPSTAFGGPGSYIKTIILIPSGTTVSDVDLAINGDNVNLWNGSVTYAELPPPRILPLGITTTSGNVSFSSMPNDMTAIVTGYFTPTV